VGATGKRERERERGLGLLTTVTPVGVKSGCQEKKRANSVLWKRLGVLIAVRIKIVTFQAVKTDTNIPPKRYTSLPHYMVQSSTSDNPNLSILEITTM
jgi:hypothetical protein